MLLYTRQCTSFRFVPCFLIVQFTPLYSTFNRSVGCFSLLLGSNYFSLVSRLLGPFLQFLPGYRIPCFDRRHHLVAAAPNQTTEREKVGWWRRKFFKKTRSIFVWKWNARVGLWVASSLCWFYDLGCSSIPRVHRKTRKLSCVQNIFCW